MAFQIFSVDLDRPALFYGASFALLSAAGYLGVIANIVSEKRNILLATFIATLKVILFFVAVAYLSTATNRTLLAAFLGFISILPVSFIVARL